MTSSCHCPLLRFDIEFEFEFEFECFQVWLPIVVPSGWVCSSLHFLDCPTTRLRMLNWWNRKATPQDLSVSDRPISEILRADKYPTMHLLWQKCAHAHVRISVTKWWIVDMWLVHDGICEIVVVTCYGRVCNTADATHDLEQILLVSSYQTVKLQQLKHSIVLIINVQVRQKYKKITVDNSHSNWSVGRLVFNF